VDENLIQRGREEGETTTIEEVKKSKHKLCVCKVNRIHLNRSSYLLLYFVFVTSRPCMHYVDLFFEDTCVQVIWIIILLVV
jgi:hypothetical protein